MECPFRPKHPCWLNTTLVRVWNMGQTRQQISRTRQPRRLTATMPREKNECRTRLCWKTGSGRILAVVGVGLNTNLVSLHYAWIIQSILASLCWMGRSRFGSHEMSWGKREIGFLIEDLGRVNEMCSRCGGPLKKNSFS